MLLLLKGNFCNMARRIRVLLLLILCLLQFLPSEEQTNLPGYSVVNYNSDNALPQNSINGMAFDRNGFLWLATEMGMVRFDGRNFREYNMRNSAALGSNRFSLISLAEEPGKIRIESLFASHRILTVTDDYQLQVDTVLSTNPYESHLPNNHLFSFTNLYKKAAAGDTAAFGGLFDRLDLNGDVLTVNEKQAYAKKGASCYYLDENKAVIQLLPELTNHALKIEFMVGDVFIYIDRQNRLYAYKEGVLQKISGSARLLKLLGQVDVTGPYPMMATLKALRDTRHSFLAYKGSILLLSMQNGLLDLETLVTDSSITSINCLIYDQQYKMLFVGTATSGLYVLKKQDFRRLYFATGHYAINSLYAQVELPDGSILTSSGILNRHNKVNMASPGIYDRPAFLKSSAGDILYSSYGYLRKTDTSLRNSVTLANIGFWVVSIVEAPDKDIFFCNPSKIFRLRGSTVTLLYDDSTGLMGHADIEVIQSISSGELWIGTTSGLYSYDLSTGAIRNLPGMGKASVRAIYKARDASIWLGTYGQGFYKYVKGNFIRMPIDPGNNLINVHCFMEDKQGYFWLPTNKGLYRVSKKELDSYGSGGMDNVFYYYFDKSSGFTSNEFNGGCTPCGIVKQDGSFSLPSLDGLIQFDPDSITIVPPDHPIFIEHFTPDGKNVSGNDFFKRDQNTGPLVFTISSPYSGNTANLRLEYSIPGLDDKWHPVAKDGRLELTGLHHGDFRLIIRKQEGYARYRYKTVRWTIIPYWYQTIWFQLCTAVLAISILPIIFWLRYTRQVKLAGQLEQRVAERTQALSESNRVKEKMIAIILHDLRSPLRFLHMLAIHIYNNSQKVPAPVLSDMLLKFRNATHDLYEFAQDFLVWTNVQKEGFVVQQERIVLREIVEEIVSLYEPGADIRNNIVLNLVPATITLISDPHILKLLIRNLTDNANKYTMNGEIKIEAAQDAAAIRIIITDTGRSMEKELVADILNNRYQANDDSHGFGYKIILELLARIRGELAIDRPCSTGNRITLRFRVGDVASALSHHPADHIV